MDIIAKNKQTGKSFSIFKGTETECREKLVGLKFSQLEPDSGLHLKNYEFTLNKAEKATAISQEQELEP